MTIRLGIAATAAAALLICLAASMASLLTTLGHPLSITSVERMGALFITIPFLVVGVAGLALGSVALPERWRGPLTLTWALLVAGLCLAGPLAGPYGALFEHATGWSAESWQAGWTTISAWPYPVDLGLARLPVLVGAAVTAGLAAIELVQPARLRERIVPALRHLHVPRRHATHGAA
jgi:hypothetical protein